MFPPRLLRATVVLLLLGLLGSALTLASNPGDAGPPMREEDVVRMLVQGRSTEEILEAIRSRPVEFELSPELQDELRLAGVPDEVIAAMLARKAELDPEPPATDSLADSSAQAVPMLGVVLESSGGAEEPPLLELGGTIGPELQQAWRLDASTVGEPFEDVALYLVCRSATHVPDHWRSRSPLGRDFVSMPRHRMLSFVSGADKRGKEKAPILALKLPPVVEVTFEAPGEHDLLLGIAVQAGGRYFRLTDDVWDELTVENGTIRIRAEIEKPGGGGLDSLDVRFDRSPPTTPEDE